MARPGQTFTNLAILLIFILLCSVILTSAQRNRDQSRRRKPSSTSLSHSGREAIDSPSSTFEGSGFGGEGSEERFDDTEDDDEDEDEDEEDEDEDEDDDDEEASPPPPKPAPSLPKRVNTSSSTTSSTLPPLSSPTPSVSSSTIPSPVDPDDVPSKATTPSTSISSTTVKPNSVASTIKPSTAIVKPITNPDHVEGSGHSLNPDDEDYDDPDDDDDPEELPDRSSPPSTVSSTPVPAANSSRHPILSPPNISSTSKPSEDGEGAGKYPGEPDDPDSDSDLDSENDVSKEVPKVGLSPGYDINSISKVENGPRGASFFAQPGILAAVIGGAVLGLLFAVLLVMFILYRIRKKDEGVYTLEDPKRVTYARNDY